MAAGTVGRLIYQSVPSDTVVAFCEIEMRTVGLIASFAARHALAVGAVFVVGCVFWTLAYFGLLLWAVIAGGGLGSPVVYPLGLLIMLVGTTVFSLLLFMPATLAGEVVCRLRSLPTVVGIPVTFALFSVLSLAWSVIAHVSGAFDGPHVWSLALGIVVVLAIPLGVYWWAAEFPHVVWDVVRWGKGEREKVHRRSPVV